MMTLKQARHEQAQAHQANLERRRAVRQRWGKQIGKYKQRMRRELPDDAAEFETDAVHQPAYRRRVHQKAQAIHDAAATELPPEAMAEIRRALWAHCRWSPDGEGR